MKFTCGNQMCEKMFISNHSTAKYCSRSCAGKINIKDNITLQDRTKNRRYTDEFLLKNLLELSERLGRTPTMREVKRPDAWVYQQRFGSYNNAIVAVGLVPNIPLPPSFFEKDRNLVSLSLRYRVLKRDGFRCQYCGGTPQDGYFLHADHIISRSKGGLTVEENLKAACWLCNEGKSDS